ncbi:MAG TPA: hypothetical protein VK544_04045 [Gemmatimonadaceae bacterium]|nr:hypothetical protein [Gemmatimonadaceae bacterium]
MRSGPILLETLLLAIAAHGLTPETLTPWRGWVLFKEYVRSVAESPDPGVSVQISRDDADGTVSLIFVRQVVEPVEDWLHPIGGVVCEMTFQLGKKRLLEWDLWSFDSPTFDRFEDVVVNSYAFEELVGTRPVASSVYWLET